MEFGLTPIETLEKHHAIAKEEGLKYAYLGNVPGH
jgi:pyruvate formate lyase activating enzyme